MVLLLIYFSFPLLGKVWTSVDGHQIEGEVFEVDEDLVGLRVNGRDYYFKISRFKIEDQSYLQKWASEKRCSACSGEITSEPKEAGNRIFHTKCFRCLYCSKLFKGGDALGKDPWGGLVHLNHLEQVSTCDACSKFFRRKEAWPRQFFPDGRKNCKQCLEDGVFDLNRLSEVRDRIIPVLSGVGLELPPKPVSIHLVDRPFLDREAKKIGTKGNLRGLTLTKYKVVRGKVSVETSFEHRIYVLYGLPYVECISVLAHEYGHVWLNERFIETTPLETEGFCNLISEICLAQDRSKAAFLKRENLIKSENPIYGHGFRKMRQKLLSLGWPGLLDEMRRKSSPP